MMFAQSYSCGHRRSLPQSVGAERLRRLLWSWRLQCGLAKYPYCNSNRPPNSFPSWGTSNWRQSSRLLFWRGHELTEGTLTLWCRGTRKILWTLRPWAMADNSFHKPCQLSTLSTFWTHPKTLKLDLIVTLYTAAEKLWSKEGFAQPDLENAAPTPQYTIINYHECRGLEECAAETLDVEKQEQMQIQQLELIVFPCWAMCVPAVNVLHSLDLACVWCKAAMWIGSL